MIVKINILLLGFLWVFIFLNSLGSFIKKTLQPWNSLQHNAFFKNSGEKEEKQTSKQKTNPKNHYLQLCNKKEWKYESVFFTLPFERFCYQSHPIISQRYEAVNLFLIHSFEEQFKSLEIGCQKSSYFLNFIVLSR